MRKPASVYARMVWIGATSLILSGCLTPTTWQPEVDSDRYAEEARKQSSIALQAILEDQTRVQRVAFPLLEAAAPFAGKRVRYCLGFYSVNRYSFSERFLATASEVYGLGERLQVIAVVPGSPAERAGLLPGDQLTALNGVEFAQGKEASEAMGNLLQEQLQPELRAVLTILRDKERKDLHITPIESADFPIILSHKHEVNAKATGKKVVVNRGLVRFAQSDGDLAFVISHELAHNIMHHVRAVMTNYAIGTALDIAAASVGVITGNAIGATAAIAQAPAFEAEADYVGLYIMARAGLEIDHAAEFWREMAAISPGIMRKRIPATHPTSPQRYIAMDATIREINQWKQEGRPLIPQLKRKPSD